MLLASKQYMVLAAPRCRSSHWRRRTGGVGWQNRLAVLVVALIVTLPLALWDWTRTSGARP
jgi:hypothetical protein